VVLQHARSQIKRARVKSACFSDIAGGFIALRSDFRSDPERIRDDKVKLIFLSHASAALKELSSALEEAQTKVAELKIAPRGGAMELSNQVSSVTAGAKLILSLIDKPGELKSLLTSTNETALKPYVLAANRFAPHATGQILADLIALDAEGKSAGSAKLLSTNRLALLAQWDADLGACVAKKFASSKRVSSISSGTYDR
jgi:hypothetical protein